MRAIEREFDLQRVTPSIEVQRRALTKGEIEEGLRTGVPSTRQRLQQLSEDALAGPLRGWAAEVLVQGLGRHGANAICRVDGRLEGFTNQQVQRTAKQHPFVLVTECEGRVAPAAPAYLARLEQEGVKAQTVQRDQVRSRSRGRER